jgi:hypothetical protein
MFKQPAKSLFRFLWIHALFMPLDNPLDAATDIDTIVYPYKNATIVATAETTTIAAEEGSLE